MFLKLDWWTSQSEHADKLGKKQFTWCFRQEGDKCDYLSVGSTCVYFEDPPMKVKIAASIAIAGIANPMAHDMLSWI